MKKNARVLGKPSLKILILTTSMGSCTKHNYFFIDYNEQITREVAHISFRISSTLKTIKPKNLIDGQDQLRTKPILNPKPTDLGFSNNYNSYSLYTLCISHLLVLIWHSLHPHPRLF